MSSKFFKDGYDYCDETRNLDNMIEKFNQDRAEVTDLLKNDPTKLIKKLWTNTSPICKDDDCLFNMGSSLRIHIDDILNFSAQTNTMVNYYVCPQCKNMKRIIDFSVTKNGQPFFIECGERAGSQLVYTRSSIKNLYMVHENMPLTVQKVLASKNIKDLIKCSSSSCLLSDTMKNFRKYKNMNYLGTDSFTNNLLINWFLMETKSPNIVENLISFICNEEGYSLYEYLELPNINSLQNISDYVMTSKKPSPTAKADDKSPLKKEVVKGIIVQLFSTLHNLRQYDFSHGNPSSKTIRFTKKPVSYLHDGVHVVSPITLKIIDFSKSGCTINNTRLYTKSVIVDNELKKRELETFIQTFDREGVTIYKIKDPYKCVKSSLMFMYIQHLGIPIYQASFDAYAFMMVLMSERSFYSTLMNDIELEGFFKAMFVCDSDYSKIKNRLMSVHDLSNGITSKDVLSLLANLNLRCDMIDYGWEQIMKW